MASPNSKKRTLSEQKETDVDAKKAGLGGDQKQDELENVAEEIDTLATYMAYLEAKCQANEQKGQPFVLIEEWESLRQEWSEKNPDSNVPIDVALNKLHGTVVSENALQEMENINKDIDEIIEAADEEEEDDAARASIAKKIQEYLKKKLTAIKTAWDKKEYPTVFDLLFVLAYEGCVRNDMWYEEQKEGKRNVEEIFQGVSDAWTQLLTKTDHLSLSDKHFICALMDVLKKRCEKDGYVWNFHKPKLPATETLDWPTEQKKYDVSVVFLTDDVEDSNSDDNEEEEVEDEEEGGGDEEVESGAAADENGEAEPQAKRKKL